MLQTTAPPRATLTFVREAKVKNHVCLRPSHAVSRAASALRRSAMPGRSVTSAKAPNARVHARVPSARLPTRGHRGPSASGQEPRSAPAPEAVAFLHGAAAEAAAVHRRIRHPQVVRRCVANGQADRPSPHRPAPSALARTLRWGEALSSGLLPTRGADRPNANGRRPNTNAVPAAAGSFQRAVAAVRWRHARSPQALRPRRRRGAAAPPRTRREPPARRSRALDALTNEAGGTWAAFRGGEERGESDEAEVARLRTRKDLFEHRARQAELPHQQATEHGAVFVEHRQVAVLEHRARFDGLLRAGHG